ncbi:hypothetical protein LPB142_10030 [Rhodobacter xanthinilyticus]|uniref:Uncharacterized protein n=1 Tax=Rhodobacter xanthinilyticus TaxID=1850250 RepID=A0A1D9MCP3_9RHOB|nr:DUF6614 family protein [Rhodobacter xanthinilyticus]AOZ69611.1 hypothetical protein LPB142_10030 [Rhodobacter xanthinilyticus]
MNLYHCMIELKSDAKALAFASALEQWMSELSARGLIGNWRLMRRKLGLAGSSHSDFLLEIEVASMSALDQAFRTVGQLPEGMTRHYDLMHAMIASAEMGLYRPFPDPERRERIALI